MTDPSCKKCKQVTKEAVPDLGGILYEDDLWIVVHKGSPIGVEGHLQIVAKRHTIGFVDFTEAEAAAIGPILTRCQRALLKASGASRIYTAALGASFPHFHAHMVPVYDSVQPVTGTAWDVFLQEKLAADGALQECDFLSRSMSVSYISNAHRFTVIADMRTLCPSVAKLTSFAFCDNSFIR